MCDVRFLSLMDRVSGRVREVAGQEVEQGQAFGRALGTGMAAYRHDSSAGATHVPEQGLEDVPRANHLLPSHVLRPARCVDDSRGQFGARVVAEQFGHSHQPLG